LATGDKSALQWEDDMRCAHSHTPPAVIASRSQWTRWNDRDEAATTRTCEAAVFGFAGARAIHRPGRVR
jgi:hypothetical protein